MTFGQRQWRVRGIAKNLSYESLRVQLRVKVAENYHLDTLDLCNAKHRQGFLAAAQEEQSAFSKRLISMETSSH
jgi:DNA primase